MCFTPSLRKFQAIAKVCIWFLAPAGSLIFHQIMGDHIHARRCKEKSRKEMFPQQYPILYAGIINDSELQTKTGSEGKQTVAKAGALLTSVSADAKGSAHMLAFAFVPAFPQQATGGDEWEGGWGRSQQTCF